MKWSKFIPKCYCIHTKDGSYIKIKSNLCKGSVKIYFDTEDDEQSKLLESLIGIINRN